MFLSSTLGTGIVSVCWNHERTGDTRSATRQSPRLLSAKRPPCSVQPSRSRSTGRGKPNGGRSRFNGRQSPVTMSRFSGHQVGADVADAGKPDAGDPESVAAGQVQHRPHPDPLEERGKTPREPGGLVGAGSGTGRGFGAAPEVDFEGVTERFDGGAGPAPQGLAGEIVRVEPDGEAAVLHWVLADPSRLASRPDDTPRRKRASSSGVSRSDAGR